MVIKHSKNSSCQLEYKTLLVPRQESKYPLENTLMKVGWLVGYLTSNTKKPVIRQKLGAQIVM